MNSRGTSSPRSPIATPAEVRQAAERQWPTFLRHWIRGELPALFPLRLRLRTKVSPAAKVSLPDLAAAVQTLRKAAKESLGAGYTVHYARRRSQQWGEQDFPDYITIDSADDLLALLGKRETFQQAEQVCTAVRAAFPELESWLVQNVRCLDQFAPVVDRLIAVCRTLQHRPQPDCFVRELDVPVDTKFIQQHETTLRHWLDRLLPPAAIRVEEQSFARRYGLRDGLPHHLLRVLDHNLLAELSLPFDELSLPMRHLAKLPVQSCRVIIVENRTSLLTLPPSRRTLALGGVGDAATRLRDVPWLAQCDLFYWGDLDVDGFRILRNLRRLFPSLRSLMMDASTLAACRHLTGPGNGKTDDSHQVLSLVEYEALRECSIHDLRLEQEKLPRSLVYEVISTQ